jgi:hypothetical protein
MTMTFQFCEMRADEEAAAAKAATLDNVRDRALRSEAAWREMGNRLRAVQAQRRKNEQERADAAVRSD